MVTNLASLFTLVIMSMIGLIWLGVQASKEQSRRYNHNEENSNFIMCYNSGRTMPGYGKKNSRKM